MLISMLSMSVEILEMSCAEAVDALTSQARNSKPEDLLSPLCLMCVFKGVSPNSNFRCVCGEFYIPHSSALFRTFFSL